MGYGGLSNGMYGQGGYGGGMYGSGGMYGGGGCMGEEEEECMVEWACIIKI